MYIHWHHLTVGIYSKDDADDAIVFNINIAHDNYANDIQVYDFSHKFSSHTYI